MSQSAQRSGALLMSGLLVWTLGAAFLPSKQYFNYLAKCAR